MPLVVDEVGYALGPRAANLMFSLDRRAPAAHVRAAIEHIDEAARQKLAHYPPTSIAETTLGDRRRAGPTRWT